MMKHEETLQANKDCKLTIVVFMQILPFSNSFFTRCLHESEALHIPAFYLKMNHFNIVFYMN